LISLAPGSILQTYTENLGWGPWSVFEYAPPLLHDTVVRGQPCEFRMIGAETSVDGLGFELIQPVSGPSIYQEFLDQHGEGVQHIACMLLDRSDVVSLHARLTPQNRHLFGWGTFTRMRPGSCFINTAREALVDEAALARALETGLLAGAALDVLERTPGGRHPLLDLPNVFVTPHIGGATAETLARGARRAVAAVADVLAGRTPADVVNPQVLRAAQESRAL
jgi:phosphoglycerate dehydrogenase-like enzyme